MISKKVIQKLLIKIAVILLALMLFSGRGCGNQWILFYDKPILGYVVDAETGHPIEGVIVIGMWQLIQTGSHGFGGYAKVSVVESGKKGEFKIPFWITFKPWKFDSQLDDLAPRIVIYKPGYKLYYSHKVERAGFPSNYEMTQEEKTLAKKENSITPAKLRRIYADGERMRNYDEFATEANFPSTYYSKKESNVIFNALDEELAQLKDKNEFNASHLIISNKELRQFWVGGNR